MKSGTLTRKKPLVRTPFRSEPKSEGQQKPRSRMKSKQRAVSVEEKRLWDKLAALGCIACMKDGHYQPHVSIHHIDGRTKPDCHKLVLPLCAGHHQDGTGAPGLIAVHPWKAKFERAYGSQLVLLAQCMELIA